MARLLIALLVAVLLAGCGELPEETAAAEEDSATQEEALWADRSCALLLSRGGQPLLAGFSHGLVLRSWVFVAKVDAETVLVFGTGYAPIVQKESASTQMSSCLQVLYGSAEPRDALVVFDHWHYDHTQGYLTYNEALRSVRYFGHALDADKTGPGLLSCPELFGVPAGYEHFAYPPDAPFIALDDDSSPGAGGLVAGGWRTRWCPGHTAGTLCVSHDEADIVLASDWVNGHGVILPCGNDDPAAGWTEHAEGCGKNPDLDATDCIGQSRELVGQYATRCNAHGSAGQPCCGWTEDSAAGAYVSDCE